MCHLHFYSLQKIFFIPELYIKSFHTFSDLLSNIFIFILHASVLLFVLSRIDVKLALVDVLDEALQGTYIHKIFLRSTQKIYVCCPPCSNPLFVIL